MCQYTNIIYIKYLCTDILPIAKISLYFLQPILLYYLTHAHARSFKYANNYYFFPQALQSEECVSNKYTPAAPIKAYSIAPK